MNIAFGFGVFGIGVLFETFLYIAYVRVRDWSSLVRIFRKTIKNFEVKVDVQMGTLRFRGKFSNMCGNFIQFAFYPLLSYGQIPEELCPFLLRSTFGS